MWDANCWHRTTPTTFSVLFQKPKCLLINIVQKNGIAIEKGLTLELERFEDNKINAKKTSKTHLIS
jgi:hypothetical protein